MDVTTIDKWEPGMIAERGMDTEAQVLEIIRDMASSPYGDRLTIKNITSWFADRHSTEYEKKITVKWIGFIVRRRLGLKTQKSHGVLAIPMSELPKLPRLYEKNGVSPAADEVDVETTTPQSGVIG